MSLGVSLALGFLTTAMLARGLGPAPFGLLMLVRTIVGNVGILESLFGAGITRYVAFHHARAEFDARNKFLWTGLAVNVAQGVVVSLLAVAVSFAVFDKVFSSIPSPLVDRGPVLIALFFVV